MKPGRGASLLAMAGLLALGAAPAWAGAVPSDLSDPFAMETPGPAASWTDAPFGGRYTLPVRLAQAGDEGEEGLAMHAGPAPEERWHAPWITGNKLHQYLGIGSLVAAGLAAVTAPGDDDGGGGDGEGGGFHHTAGWTAAILGGAAVGTGLVFHLDDIRLRDGFLDPDNMHALLGILATTAYFVAVNKAPGAGHGSMGELGAVAMLVSIKLAW